jgi:alpha-glucoside transport system substrate-binding protein
LPVRVAGGNAPDLALIAQPGLLKQMVQQRKALKPPAQTLANVERYWSPEWKQYGSVGGTFYAAPLSSSMKSLVWYSPKAFRQAGYEVPKTWDQLTLLSDTIANAGPGKPWCGGLASGTATGWPATDWLEQVVLRSHGGDVYDKWVSGALRFTAPEITDSMRTVGAWMQNPRWANGGFGDVRSIATTRFQEAGLPILKGQCWMLQQSSYYGAHWPAGTTIGPDGDVFAFFMPTINPAVRTPVIGAGEFVTAFADRPEVQAVQTYLSTPEWATSRIAAAPGWLSANRGVSLDSYQNPLDRLAAGYLTDPDATFRFDASDLMPAAVGTGQEWRSMTAWFAEGLPIDQVASDINAAWPS